VTPTTPGFGGNSSRNPTAIASKTRAAAVAIALSVAALALSSCSSRGAGRSPSASPTTASNASSSAGSRAAGGAEPAWEQAIEARAAKHPSGGSVRVAVWDEPDPAANTLGGAAVRALALPQLFVARPDGRWSPQLVAPNSDVTADDERSATFRLRPSAAWSDGTPITVDDLRRSADPRFVAAVEPTPGADARAGLGVVVRFTQSLPGWRRLWSGTESIAPPAPGLWGGPFLVASRTPGLETILRRNDRWAGAHPAFLDQVTLVLVPDPITARQLLGRGELDVVMPLPGIARTPQLEGTAGVDVAGVNQGGWSVVLLANSDRLSLPARRALFATVDRSRFVAVLLAGEANRLDGFAGPEDATWKDAAAGDAASLKGRSIDLVGMFEEPMTALLHRSMQKRVRVAGGTIELRQAEADRVEGWLRDRSYDAALAVWLDPPGGCWRCRWEGVAGGESLLAAGADTGDPSARAAIETRLRDEAAVLPLWRPRTVIAWRREVVAGPVPNGYASSAAWNADQWWHPS